jgi:hypothetical protein
MIDALHVSPLNGCDPFHERNHHSAHDTLAASICGIDGCDSRAAQRQAIMPMGEIH